MIAIKPSLPQPDETALAHSQQLLHGLIDKIQKQQKISFVDFMEYVLYEPGLGYYSAGARKFGAAGDFVTAPEISPLFSYCLARQCQQIIEKVHHSSIMEIGAGTGVMAGDILIELEKQQCLPQNYYILDRSADLKQRQYEILQGKIPHLINRVVWLDKLPEKFNGVILANEVLDAMPVHKFKIAPIIQEFFVALDKNNSVEHKLIWQLAPANQQLIAALQPLQLPISYESEINLSITPWLKSLASSLNTGVILLIDYGFPQHEYYHKDRDQGTLMCHYRHHAHADPLILLGLQDITAHVDFTAVAKAGVAAGLCLAGFTSQAMFLLNCGIDKFIAATEAIQHFKLTQQIKKLTLPSEMGELFKAIAFTKNFTEQLIGFMLYDRQEKLYDNVNNH